MTGDNRKQVEEALRESEAKYKRLIENLGKEYFFYRHDANGVFTYLSPSITDMLGYSRQEFLTHYTEYLSDNPLNEKVVQHSNLSVQGQQQPPYEVEIYHKDRSIRWLEVTEHPIRGDDGKVIAVEGVAHDITERKLAENEIRHAKGFVESIIKNVPGVIYSRDGELNITFISPKCSELYGYSEEEFKKMPDLWYKVVHPAEQHLIKDIAGKIISGRPFSVEYRIINKNGEILWVRDSGTPVLDPEGALERIDGAVFNITENKMLEEQLMHSQKMESIGTLAGGVAHDFNNILTAVIGFASILNRRMQKDDPLKLYVEQIQAAAENASILTTDLLTFSRKHKNSLTLLNLNDTVARLKKFLLRIIGEDIQFRTVLTSDRLNIMADFSQMEQVLMNLAANARDAMPEGGVLTISAESARIDDEFIRSHGYGRPGDYAVISISDTGVGMDEKTREKIFEPFFTTKDMDKGTGLGLSIVYGIIKQHNGYINVYSGPGMGTTFKIYLPLTKQEEERTEENPSGPSALTGGTETILVAEDEPMVREFLMSILTECGYRVITAGDGNDAVNKFMENKDEIQLILSDVIMPGKNGKEAYEEIKKIKPDIKGIFLSGYATETMRKEISARGLKLISKPVRPEDLLRALREELDG